jgi:hypothetical protein
MKRYIFIVTLISALIVFSCASTGTGAAKRGNMLPLSNGWYLYATERTFKAVETEQNFYISSGMKMTQEITYKYTGVVVRVDNGALFDPVTGIELKVDNSGNVSCAENISIRGTITSSGNVNWSGLQEGPAGDLNSIFVKGTLTFLPSSARGGKEFDGVYYLTDSGTGRKQLARISDGFYTWQFIDSEAPIASWPTLIQPDGSFSFGMEITTVLQMGALGGANYSTDFTFEGKVIPGQGISMEESSISAGIGQNLSNKPHVFSGALIREGEFPNEAIPADIDSIIHTGRTAVREAPKPNRSRYPSWYLTLPKKAGFIYAAGEKTFNDRNTAFAMAEAAAAANLADQVMTDIESLIIDVSNNRGTRTEEIIRTESIQQLNYKVIEQTYNNETHTAFVLLEMESK